jgi:uncharacterized protein (DUF488 family)
VTRDTGPGATAYSIGFTGKRAEEFFGLLRRAGIRRIVDVRLRNTSALAGFTRRGDLPFFLRELCGAEYRHEPLLSPSEALFRGIKGGTLAWPDYEKGFRRLMAERRVEARVDRALFDTPTALLCAEPIAEHCHRRLVLEYLNERWGDPLRIVHL